MARFLKQSLHISFDKFRQNVLTFPLFLNYIILLSSHTNEQLYVTVSYNSDKYHFIFNVFIFTGLVFYSYTKIKAKIGSVSWITFGKY